MSEESKTVPYLRDVDPQDREATLRDELARLRAELEEANRACAIYQQDIGDAAADARAAALDARMASDREGSATRLRRSRAGLVVGGC